jgi:hypothetical protein
MANESKKDALIKAEKSAYLKHSFFGGFDSADLFLEQLHQQQPAVDETTPLTQKKSSR